MEQPKRPEYALQATRLETLQSWPNNHNLKPDDLAAAGFYYTGVGDCVRCFFCGGGLKNWKDTDDAWEEHAANFPKCGHVSQHKEVEFVKKKSEIETRSSWHRDTTVRHD
jgi:hypothetical protein